MRLLQNAYALLKFQLQKIITHALTQTLDSVLKAVVYKFVGYTPQVTRGS